MAAALCNSGNLCGQVLLGVLLVNFGVYNQCWAPGLTFHPPLIHFLGSLSLCTLEGFEESVDTGAVCPVLRTGTRGRSDRQPMGLEEHTLQALVAPETLWLQSLGSGDIYKLSEDPCTCELLLKPFSGLLAPSTSGHKNYRKITPLPDTCQGERWP